MTNDDILELYPAPEVRKFREDFAELLRVASELDRYYTKTDKDVDDYIKKFRTVLKDFGKKYKGLILKLVTTADELRLKIFVEENNLKDFFSDSASKIKGIVSAGLYNFNEVNVSDTEKFSKMIDSIKDSLYISYSDVGTGTSNVAVFYSPSEKAVEILADLKELANMNSANFKIVAFYALKGGINSDIEVHEKLMAFGFYNLLNEVEKREWYERHSSRFLE